jgi:signal transduction histidine kinase
VLTEELAARTRRSIGRHPLLADATLALGVYLLLTLAVTTTAEETLAHGPEVGALVNTVLVTPLVWRRRAPLAVLTAVLVGTVVTGSTVGWTGGEAAALVALTTAVAAEPTWRRACLPATLAAVGVPAGLVAAGSTDDRDHLAAGIAALVAAVAIGAASRLAAERAAGREQEEAQRTALAIAAERGRIARELHDVVAHDVTVMVSLADGAQVALGRSPDRAREAMGQVAATGRGALRELRGLLGVLAGDEAAGSTPQPGLDGLPELVERMRAAGLNASLDVAGLPPDVDPMAQLTLYRVTQEALTNVLRHATSATRADVRLHTDGQVLQLQVRDDGHAPSAADPGRGMLGMRQRADLHGGHLTAGPEADGGWRVALALPLVRTGAGG